MASADEEQPVPIDPAVVPQRMLYDKTEAAALLSISVRFLDRLLADGEIETVQLGRRRLVAHADLEAYVERLRDHR